MAQPDLAALVNAVVDDPEVKSAVKQLALDALAETREMLTGGSSLVRQSVIKMLLPSLIASLKETQTGDGLEELRAEQVKLFAAMRDAQ